jgi:uncharacterized membrane protein YfcA
MVDLSGVLLLIIVIASTVLSTVVGGGGGLVVVPLLILVYGQSPNTAIATSFAAFTVGAFTSTFAYSRQGRVDYRAGLMLGMLTLPGIVVGAFVTASLPTSLFNIVLGIVTCVLSIPMFLKRNATRESLTKNDWVRNLIDSSDTSFSYVIRRKIAVTGAIVTGIVSGVFGAGGGLILTPAMVLSGFPVHIALATMGFIGIVLALGGTITRYSLGQVQVSLALWLCVGNVLGSFIGARLARLASNTLLTKIVAVSVLVLGLLLVAQSLL